MTELRRPQPLGVFPLPAGLLLIGGDDPLHDSARAELVAGRRPELPAALRYYALALDDDADGSLAAITAPGPISTVNRLVLDPTPERLAAARAAAAGDDDLATCVELVAFVAGLAGAPPDPSRADGELAANIHAAHASLALQRGDRDAAIDHLETAAQLAAPVSPPLAGQLLGQLAHLHLDGAPFNESGTTRARVTFQAALDALDGTDLALSRAELHVATGSMLQELSEAAPRFMRQATDHYQAALRLVDRTSAPQTWAIANSNLGLAYLTTPMLEASDQLRIGIAVQSLREALTVLDPDTDPDRWSSTQLNLANALVYMPSTHQEENIAAAVELYERVLERRDRQRDPQGRARVLANLGNALAHLGAFADAKGRLHEARAIFEEFEAHDAVRSVRSILDEIAKHESLQRQDAGR